MTIKVDICWDMIVSICEVCLLMTVADDRTLTSESTSDLRERERESVSVRESRL